MAFSKKTWKDRVSQYINRRLLTDSDGNTQQVTVTRDEGSVTEAGDAFSASNMNDLENRIEAAIPVKIQDLDNVTLTTSDNNKLLGVSVDGSDISVGAFSITPTELSITKHNFSTNDTQVVRVGNLLICSISVLNTSSYNSWTDLCSITGSFDSNITIMASLSTWDKSRYAQAYMYSTNEIRVRIMGADANASYRGQMIIPIDL